MTVCPNIEQFDILRVNEPDFPDWLEAQLKNFKATPLSQSELGLSELVKDGELWKSLGGSTAVHMALREKLGSYREDLDKADWIDILKLLVSCRLKEEEYKFIDPNVLARRARFKAPQGFVMTDTQWRKIERIIEEEVRKLQDEDRREGK